MDWNMGKGGKGDMATKQGRWYEAVAIEQQKSIDEFKL